MSPYRKPDRKGRGWPQRQLPLARENLQQPAVRRGRQFDAWRRHQAAAPDEVAPCGTRSHSLLSASYSGAIQQSLATAYQADACGPSMHYVKQPALSPAEFMRIE